MVEPTPLKHISEIGNLPQIGVKIEEYLKPPPRKKMGKLIGYSLCSDFLGGENASDRFGGSCH